MVPQDFLLNLQDSENEEIDHSCDFVHDMAKGTSQIYLSLLIGLSLSKGNLCEWAQIHHRSLLKLENFLKPVIGKEVEEILSTRRNVVAS